MLYLANIRTEELSGRPVPRSVCQPNLQNNILHLITLRGPNMERIRGEERGEGREEMREQRTIDGDRRGERGEERRGE